MRCAPTETTRRILLVLLVVFAARALVPPGYMPARERPWSFEICPEGWPAGLAGAGADAHHMGAHGHGAHRSPHARMEHCVFGTLCVPGPASCACLPALLLTQALVPIAAVPDAPPRVPGVRLPHARGPPTPA